MKQTGKHDYRHIAMGREIPSEHYCDQPYFVVNADGSWTCVLTTGPGIEGQAGQHIVSLITRDQGRSWEGPFDIEPQDGPEASWAMPLLVPATGRIYVFYTYNADNIRSMPTVDGETLTRVDSLGMYAYRYSENQGRTWSTERFEIPMRRFACDHTNVTGGDVLFFWGVGKPFIHRNKVYVLASKIGNFGPGLFHQNEGVLFCSDNLLDERDPTHHRWQTLPDGDIGLRTPPGGGSIAGELNATPMADGSLFATYRTIDGWSCQAYSRDDGHHWSCDWMDYGPGTRRVKNPRSANFVRRFSNGRYLYWFCFHGGHILQEAIADAPWKGYAHRNPIFLCGGTERDGYIHWSQPEIALYDDRIGNRMSYPDFIEADGAIYVSETQKSVARIHHLDPDLLTALWRDHDDDSTATDGLILDLDAAACLPGATIAMPRLPTLFNREAGGIDNATSASSADVQAADIQDRGGFSLELQVRFEDLSPWQVLFDSRDDQGAGLLVQLTDRGTVALHLASYARDAPGAFWANGGITNSWTCDPDLIRPGVDHVISFLVDGGSKLILPMVDGQLCDGGERRQFGWGRFHPCMRCPNGAERAHIAPSLHGTLTRLRLYERCLFTNEAAANHRAARSFRSPGVSS